MDLKASRYKYFVYRSQLPPNRSITNKIVRCNQILMHRSPIDQMNLRSFLSMSRRHSKDQVKNFQVRKCDAFHSRRHLQQNIHTICFVNNVFQVPKYHSSKDCLKEASRWLRMSHFLMQTFHLFYRSQCVCQTCSCNNKKCLFELPMDQGRWAIMD